MRNFSKTFRKNVTYDTFKSYKKAGLEGISPKNHSGGAN